MFVSSNPIYLIIFWGIFFFSFSVHEATHAWVAYKMGDPTAKSLGRVTLNPLKHLDLWNSAIMPIMTFMIVGIPFGGGKPVPINPYFMRDFRWGNFLSTISAPFTNLVLAAFFFIVLTALYHSGLYPVGSPGYLGVYMGALLNLILFTFNMLPIPPLDGWSIVEFFMKRERAEKSMFFQRFGMIAVLFLFFTGAYRFVIFPVLWVAAAAAKAGLGLVTPPELEYLNWPLRYLLS